MSGPSDADLDDILNSALADFEEDELDNERHDHVAQQKQTDDMVTKMGSLMEGIQNPAHGASLEETFRQLSTGSGEMPDLAAFLDPAAAAAATRGGAKPKGGAGADEDEANRTVCDEQLDLGGHLLVKRGLGARLRDEAHLVRSANVRIHTAVYQPKEAKRGELPGATVEKSGSK